MNGTWQRDGTLILTPAEVAEATERARLMAANNILHDPAARLRVETRFGKQFCMERWPEAYGHESLGGPMRLFKNAVQSLKTLIPFLLMGVLVLSQGLYALDTTNPSTFRAPTVYAGSNTQRIYWTAGTIYNGGDTVSIAAGNADLGDAQTDCAAPTFTACNFLYANSAGVVAVTQTLATATGAGNTLMALVETSGANVANIVLPQQSGTLWLQAAGPNLGAVTTILPSGAGTIDLGSGDVPFRSAYLGTAANQGPIMSVY